MNIGMLWLDDDKKRSLEEKVTRAVAYYKDKYGKTPNLCCVWPQALEEETKLGKIAIRPVNHIRPQHFWVGMQVKSS